jgi:hypothetical protein
MRGRICGVELGIGEALGLGLRPEGERDPSAELEEDHGCV